MRMNGIIFLTTVFVLTALLCGPAAATAEKPKADYKANKPPAPAEEFAVVLSPGYGTIDHFSTDPKVFENL